MLKKLRIVYIGTAEFAVTSLEKLIEEKYNIVAVITSLDKRVSRNLKIQSSPVKKVAMKYNLPILQPKNLKSEEFIKTLSSYQADLQIVVAFRILPEVVWIMPKMGTFNLHPSLLPQYRGAAPINWAIINGEKETGLTTFFIKKEVDTGDIILQEKHSILPEDNAGTLYQRLMEKGADIVVKTTKLIEKGGYQPKTQILKDKVKKAPKILKEDCKIDFTKSTNYIHNFIRGLSPYPGAWTILKGKKYKIFHSEKLNNQKIGNKKQGYYTDNQIFLYFKTSDGWISIKEIQAESKKRMRIEDFLRGNRL